MNIRLATRSDETKIQKLFLELYQYHTSEVLTDPIKSFVKVESPQQYAQKTVAGYFSEEYFLFLAEKDSQVVGYICGKINERAEYQIHPEGFIEDWFVTENERGRGVGRKLYQKLLEKFSEWGCQTVALEVFYDNHSAMQVYEKLGFYKDAIFLKKRI